MGHCHDAGAEHLTSHTSSRAHHAPPPTTDNQFRRVERLFKQPLPQEIIDLTTLEPEALHISRRELKRIQSHLTAERISEVQHAWQQVIDVRATADDSRWQTHALPTTSDMVAHHHSAHAFPPTARLHTFAAHPGFALLTDALSPAQQLHWAARCVKEFSTVQHSNLTNLLAQSPTATDEQFTEARTLWQREVSQYAQHHQQRQDTDNDTNDCKYDTPPDKPCSAFDDFRKLRWTCLGYHYDWTQRSYAADKRDADFDAELNALCDTFAKAADYSNGIKCEAAIVNYYWSPPTTGHTPLQRDSDSSSMGGHVDDAELTTEQPIVSISLGNSAVFLLGGTTRATAPSAILLRSGDVAVMGGQSRLCYHGVPRVLPGSYQLPTYTDIDDVKISGVTSAAERDLLLQYLQSARLNINCRQVEDQYHKLTQ